MINFFFRGLLWSTFRSTPYYKTDLHCPFCCIKNGLYAVQRYTSAILTFTPNRQGSALWNLDPMRCDPSSKPACAAALRPLCFQDLLPFLFSANDSGLEFTIEELMYQGTQQAWKFEKVLPGFFSMQVERDYMCDFFIESVIYDTDEQNVLVWKQGKTKTQPFSPLPGDHTTDSSPSSVSAVFLHFSRLLSFFFFLFVVELLIWFFFKV